MLFCYYRNYFNVHIFLLHASIDGKKQKELSRLNVESWLQLQSADREMQPAASAADVSVVDAADAVT